MYKDRLVSFSPLIITNKLNQMFLYRYYY